MRAPAFWNIKTGRDSAPVLRFLLSPLGAIYNYFTQRRIRKTIAQTLDAKVISIGNISLGGTGKTPLAAFIRAKLQNAAIVSRGYGGAANGAVKVDINAHIAEFVGDEPLMLAQTGAVFISKDRLEAANLAIQNGYKTLILDDGHQNPTIKKDISIIVIDGAVGFGNERVFPAGPLREKIKSGLARANAIVWIGDKTKAADALIGFAGPIIFARLVPNTEKLVGKYVGFCGIGRPEKFHDTLKELGAELVDFLPFGDHHYYSQKELGDLIAIAKHSNAKLITTEKDFMRLPKEFEAQTEVLKISLELENENDLLRLIGA